MAAYIGVLTSKGVTKLEDLLKFDRKQLDLLQISQRDTDILWKKIEKQKLSSVYINNEQNEKSDDSSSGSDSFNSDDLLNMSPLFRNDSSFLQELNNNIIEFSKYQIKCSFNL
jgi:hypothetical protein